MNITKVSKANIPAIVTWYGCDHRTTHANLSFHPALPPLALLSLWWVSNSYLSAVYEGINIFKSLNVVLF